MLKISAGLCIVLPHGYEHVPSEDCVGLDETLNGKYAKAPFFAFTLAEKMSLPAAADCRPNPNPDNVVPGADFALHSTPFLKEHKTKNLRFWRRSRLFLVFRYAKTTPPPRNSHIAIIIAALDCITNLLYLP